MPTSEPPRRALLLVNPKARQGDTALDAVTEHMRRGGLEIVPKPLDDPDAGPRLIREHAGSVDCVIVCGGDGTISGMAPGLLDTGLTLAILPLGTANDLARTLEIPTDLTQAAEVILAGHRRRIDVGLVNDLPFFNVATIGLGVDLARNLDSGLKRRWGRLGYAVAALKVLSRARRFSAWIVQDSQRTRVKTMQIAVGNGRHYGGGTVVDKNATIDDGRLDLYSLEMRNVWRLALMVRTFRSGEHGAWSDIRTAQSDAFEITTRRPRSVNADGELVTKTPARFGVRRAAITVIVPQPDPPIAA